jgi:ABC-type multidrug transport system fused ATPase/permease subunit
VNCFIGLLGKKYRKKCRSFVCDTAATAAAAYLKGHMENEDVTFTNIHGLFVISHKSKEQLPSDNTPLHRQVICNGIKSTLRMIEKYYIPGISLLLGVKTDAIWIKYPRTQEVLQGYQLESGDCPVPTLLNPRPDFDHKLLNTTEWIDVPEDQHTSVPSAYITGPAGSGKSTFMTKLARKDKAFVLAPT